MSKIIKQYYTDNKIPEVIIKKRIAQFGAHPDVCAEFEYWIQHGEYCVENPIVVEGYTAKSLAAKSKYLVGEGSFVMLIDLRENPQKALKQLDKGLKMK